MVYMNKSEAKCLFQVIIWKASAQEPFPGYPHGKKASQYNKLESFKLNVKK